MRKYILILFIVSLLLFMVIAPAIMASNITGAKWHGVLRITNTGAATNSVSTNFTLNTAAMITDDFLNATATNYAMQYNGADIASMPSWNGNPWAVFVNTIGAGQNINYDLYTDNVTGYTPSYFPASTGMAVTDHASLEIGGSGTASMDNVYLNTSVTAGYAAISGNTTGLGTSTTVNITMPAGLAIGDLVVVIAEVYDVAGAVNPTITPEAGYATLFNTAVSTTSRFAAYWKIATGTEGSGNWAFSVNSYYSYKVLRFTGAGSSSYTVYNATTATGAASSPDPPSLTTGLGAVPITWIATAGSYNVATVAPAGYSGLQSSGANSAFSSFALLNSTAASENPGTFTTAATTWGANTLGVKIVNPFIQKPGALFVGAATSGVITAQIPGGPTVNFSSASAEFENLTASVNATSGNMEIWIDGTLEDSIALGGSIPNNANNWQYGSSATPYIGQMKVTVGGVTKGQWDWEYGATFSDDSGNGNTGTPTFRTTSSDADVSAVLIELSPVTPAEFTSAPSSSSSGVVLGAPAAPITLYTDEDYSKIPGADVVNAFIDASGTSATDRIPRAMWWFPLIYIGLGIAGLCMYGVTTSKGAPGTLWAPIITIEAGYILLGLMNPIAFWGALLFVIPAFTVLTADKHQSLG